MIKLFIMLEIFLPHHSDGLSEKGLLFFGVQA